MVLSCFLSSQGAFCSETLETLTQPISEDDRRVNKSEWSEAKELMAIAEVKQLILVVQDKEIETDTLIDRCKSMMQYMKKIGRNVGPLVRGSLSRARRGVKKNRRGVLALVLSNLA